MLVSWAELQVKVDHGLPTYISRFATTSVRQWLIRAVWIAAVAQGDDEMSNYLDWMAGALESSLFAICNRAGKQG